MIAPLVSEELRKKKIFAIIHLPAIIIMIITMIIIMIMIIIVMMIIIIIIITIIIILIITISNTTSGSRRKIIKRITITIIMIIIIGVYSRRKILKIIHHKLHSSKKGTFIEVDSVSIKSKVYVVVSFMFKSIRYNLILMPPSKFVIFSYLKFRIKL